MKNDWLFVFLGTGMLTVRFFLEDRLPWEFFAVINAVTVGLLCFGITGLFLKYASHHSLGMRYLSDSSYWVYLIHLPLTIFLPGIFADWDVHALVKFFFVLLSTLVFCLLTYHFFVRNTFVGKFLNGRKYPRKKVFLNNFI